MRFVLLAMVACGGGKPTATQPKLVPVEQAPPFNEPDSTQPAIDDKELATATTKFLGLVDTGKAELIGCFNLAARRHALATKVKVALTATFDDKGNAIRIHVMPPVDRELEDCVAAVGRAWKVYVSRETTLKAFVDLELAPR